MFLYCKWQGKRVDCDKVVTQRKTDSGFCCSFNTIDMAESYDLTEEDLAEEKSVYSCPGKVVKNVSDDNLQITVEIMVDPQLFLFLLLELTLQMT